jgi:hypothetical protein
MKINFDKGDITALLRILGSAALGLAVAWVACGDWGALWKRLGGYGYGRAYLCWGYIGITGGIMLGALIYGFLHGDGE